MIQTTSSDPVSVQFTEEMKGYVAFGEKGEYQRGFDAGKAQHTPFMFHLTIIVQDTEHFVRDPLQEGIAEGYVECPPLGGRMTVEKGFFNCFVDVERPDQNIRNMRYRLFFRDKDGRALTLSGHKVVKDDGAQNVWHDTSTLYSKILEGHVSIEQEEKAAVLATGILHIDRKSVV